MVPFGRLMKATAMRRLRMREPFLFTKSLETWLQAAAFQRCTFFSTQNTKANFSADTEQEGGFDSDLKKKIFNTFLWENDPEVSFMRKKYREIANYRAQIVQNVSKGVAKQRPLTLKLLDKDIDTNPSPNKIQLDSIENNQPRYPYAENIKTSSIFLCKKPEEVKTRELDEKSKRMKMWMSDYDLYEEDSQMNHNISNSVYYGSANPNEPVSRVPCGGCGALLHCQDHSIPGYLPMELFAKRSVGELKSMNCQRCHFLKEFNVALNVCVAPDEYPEIISCIKDKRAIAVLMVDILDFPCSIWPDIMNIIGTARPIIIVGNKIDLIPGDHKGYLNHIKETLQTYVEKMGVGKGNIKHVALISAYTGFGVEDLITELHRLWEFKSDVFLVGCTNVGKSTLFNMLLQSDFCKPQAVDLVQRATTSVWPGTTLNLLKFPVLRPEGWRLALRRKRLLSVVRLRQQEKAMRKEQFGKHRMYHQPSLLQYVGRTFVSTNDDDGQNDVYVMSSGHGHKDVKESGIDDQKPEFARGRWCYDTPGVMHPDQILNILTTEELTRVIPKTAIIPRFFILKPGRSLFLAGLGRLDFISASTNESARVAVFSSSHLPITIVQTDEADYIYKKLLGSELLAVPCGGLQRLAEWPGLHAADSIIEVNGLGWKTCCADIILSSAGWISISGGEKMEMQFKVWTPYSRGIHLRQPALLPYAINFRGKRIDHTPTYHTGRADGQCDFAQS